MKNSQLPALPLDAWEDSRDTLHLFLQIVGKIRFSLFPKNNHWWHVALYVSCNGFTTRPIPYQNMLFEIELDFINHQLCLQTSEGHRQSFSLEGLSVSSFYKKLIQLLNEMGINVVVKSIPYDLPFSTIPFDEDETHASYDKEWIEKYRQILSFVYVTFEEFRSRFINKSTPIHFFWHHADLALTRFSGNKAPPLTEGSKVDKEAYSHEVISCGFWVGDNKLREPAFYTYVYPEPENLQSHALHSEHAKWNTSYGYTMALLRYEDVRLSQNPRQTLLAYLQDAYQICANQAAWNTALYKLI